MRHANKAAKANAKGVMRGSVTWNEADANAKKLLLLKSRTLVTKAIHFSWRHFSLQKKWKHSTEITSYAAFRKRTKH